jgi:hypothetical protein
VVWLIPASFIAALLLVAAGAVALVVEAHALQSRMESIEAPPVNVHRFERALEQLQRDLDAATLLFERARRAVTQINAGLEELGESPLARPFRSRES